MREWVDVPTLTPDQKGLVVSLYEVSKKGDIREFVFYKDLLVGQFPDDIIQAIVKARAEGIGAKVN